MTLRYCSRCKDITSHTDYDFKHPKKNGLYIKGLPGVVPVKSKCDTCKRSVRLAY